ncbi:MAG: hypothetical protein QGH49_12285 [SAR324 cluster bacterium]|jgi:hypothetical protein|nr:hypothetical protein [SAR324 cluster bacterium]
MKPNLLFSKFLLFFFLIPGLLLGQEAEEGLSSMVLDSAPRKLYSELYSDMIGNQFMVEIYEEPLEGENLVHFRAFKNGELLARKSQALAESHNFSFFINETEDQLIRPDVQELMFQVLRTLFEESEEKRRQMLVELLQDEELARNISKNLEQPDADIDEQELASLLSKSIKPPPPEIDDRKLAEEVAKNMKQPSVEIDQKKMESIMYSVFSNEELTTKISNQIQPKAAVVDVDQLAQQLSGSIVPKVDEAALAERLSESVQPRLDEAALAERLTESVQPRLDEAALAERLTESVQPRLDEVALAARLTETVQPKVNEEDLAKRLSSKIKPAVARINEDALATKLAKKLTEKEKLAAAKIPQYAELIKQVEAANQEKDYVKTISLLDEDIARRTPSEQQRVLKISGLMSVLVASKKLKTAISTINDFDLPEDQALEQLSASLEEWIQQNLIIE